MKLANKELFAQFIARIYYEIPNCKIAQFSKLKIVQAPNFSDFRNFFLAKLKKSFICPADTFDNVTGQFPIGFFIWDTERREKFVSAETDIYNSNVRQIGTKNLHANDNCEYITKWISSFKRNKNNNVGYFGIRGNDFQSNVLVGIFNHKNQLANPRGFDISLENLIPVCICFTVRKIVAPTWLNDRDQFLFPNKKWEKDIEFHNDCLVFTLFHGQNRISFRDGVNHWIPFTERQVAAKDVFESHFMSSFISGKVKQNGYINLFEQANKKDCIKREFSPAATAVFDAGRELWKYYHAQPDINVNASLYDIREHFQGRNEKGKMNSRSTDERYNELIANLRDALDALARKIEPKVYEYEFLLA
jgi:hypothetical protein